MIKEGTVVIILALIKGIEYSPILGTFIGYTQEKDVQVLLPNGMIFTGKTYEMALQENNYE